jgi:peptidoglycan hydrolase-like protein with peptidoglycan-binding domain
VWDGKSFPGEHVFTIGQSHPAVTLLGQRLIAHGYKRFYKVGPGPRFSAADKMATQAFQVAQGWKGTGANGIPGPKTWALLMAPPKPVAPTTPITMMRRGATGEAVRKLQDGLNRVFGLYSKLKEDGIFGYATERVVKEFQKRSNLKIDGVVGPVTRAELAKHNIKF